MRDKILFMLKGGEVSRYHALRTLQEETVAAHSFGVAWFLYFLDPNVRSQVLMAALAHDLAECMVGDIPAPAKRELGIGDQLNELENRLLKSAGFHFELTEEEGRILKIADCAQGALFCIRERSLGNHGVTIVYQRYMSYMRLRVSLAEVEEKLMETLEDLWRSACNGQL